MSDQYSYSSKFSGITIVFSKVPCQRGDPFDKCMQGSVHLNEMLLKNGTLSVLKNSNVLCSEYKSFKNLNFYI